MWPSFIVLNTLETGCKLGTSVLWRLSGAKWKDLDPGRLLIVRFVFIIRFISEKSFLLSIGTLSKPVLLTPICGDSIACLLGVGVLGLLIFS